MQPSTYNIETDRYAKCIAVSKRIRWEIEDDVIRGRSFDLDTKFLPDGLSKVDQLKFLNENEQRLLSQIQGRTYANIFGLVERFINAKILEVSHDHWLGDQTALEALVRFSDEELKHQALFRRVEDMIGECLPAGYTLAAKPDEVASVVLGKSSWSVLALTSLIELFTQTHYKQSIEPDTNLSELYKDIFLFHWQEESQHAILNELEWKRENASLTDAQRDQAVDDLIELVAAVDSILQAQSAVDAEYFVDICGRSLTESEVVQLKAGVLSAYRWQYIASGVTQTHFTEILGSLITEAQGERINQALAPILGH